MPNPPPSILLDLDGTLVDSSPGIAASCEAALRALGHRPDRVDIEGLIGPPLEDVLREVLATFGDDRLDQAVQAYRDHYGEHGYRSSAPYPGVAEALDSLRDLGTTLYVATSKRRVFAERILDQLDLRDRFAAIHGSEPGGALDLKRDLIADLLLRRGLSPGRSLMVGDRRHDAEGAAANGLAAIGVLWGYGSRAELDTAGVKALANAPGELAAIAADLLGLPG